MQPLAITTALAGIRRDEQIAAARSRRAFVPSRAVPAADVTIRMARPDDAPQLERLAQLDGRGEALTGDVVVAVVDDAVIAARGTRGGVISDPFRAGPEIAALLEVRAGQLAGRSVSSRHARPPRRSMPVLRAGGAR